ncbi:MAG: 2-dehydropantoate 2-reductase [Paraglaciecola sp.]
MNNLKLSIVGNGAIGNLVAASASDNKIAYTLLTRIGQRFELSLIHLNGRKRRFTPEVRKMDSPGDFDIVLLPLKAYQINFALKQLMPHIRPQHTIVLLHNGMGTIDGVKSLFPNNPIVAATTSYGAYKSDQNSLTETGLGQTHGGWVSQVKGKYSVQVETLLASLLSPWTWHQDVQLALWRKLAINAIINPLTAINQINNGELSERKYQQTIQHMCHETARVMQACGYPISESELLENVFQVIHNTAANFSSMNRDIVFERQTEIDFINGYIIEQGRRYAVETPYNNQLFNAIKQLEAKY